MKAFAVLCAILMAAPLMAYNSPEYVATSNLPHPNEAFSFLVSLKQNNLEELESFFWEVSNPNSQNFGKFMTNEDIAELVKLPEADIQTVENFLTSKSGEFCQVRTRRGVHQDYIFVDTCVGQAERMFPGIRLMKYRRNQVDSVIRTDILQEWTANHDMLSLPCEVKELVNGIMEVTDLPVPLQHLLNAQSPWLSTDKELTINDIRSYFDVPSGQTNNVSASASKGQAAAAVVEFEQAAFSASDLADFQKANNLPSNPISKIVGTKYPFFPIFNQGDIEANLDVQFLTGIAYVDTWEFAFGGFNFVTAAQTIMGTADAPKVISCSWGTNETSFGSSTLTSVNTEFQKLGAAGFSFLTASGDSGPALNPSNCTDFDPQFPGTSPYVTAVGGSKITASTGDEGAWIHSSGGFSNVFSQPSWQQGKVQTYLENANLPADNGTRYTTNGRAFPDISSFAAYYPIYVSGSTMPIGGTSGAAPVATGIFALINKARYENGKGPLGALAQTLWGLSNGVGQDITEGYTIATDRSGACGASTYEMGFDAIKGWDAATGLGSVNYNTLLAQLKDL